MIFRTRARFAITLICLTYPGLFPHANGLAEGSQPEGQAGREAPGPKRYIYRASHCAGCHNQEKNSTYQADERERMICRMNEWQYYDKHDKHQLAFAALLSERGKQIGQQLGHDVTKVDACLNCHATPDPAIKPNAQNRGRLADGVTCVACHGPFAHWVETHARYEDDEWRNLDRKSKERDYGMSDLWNPVRRAELCASCHIGNHAEGKVLTHAMYAAGHPPLSSFETATFSDAQPRHWQYVREKTRERQRRIGPVKENNLERAELVAVGGLVAFRESVKLWADQAEASTSELAAEWPDFARFDCSSCHHDLQAAETPPWRQAQSRGFRASPGRPRATAWSSVLVPIAIEALSKDTESASLQQSQFERALEQFRAAVTIRPFGDRRAGSFAARKLVSWANHLLEDQTRAVVDQVKARALLAEICARAEESIPDYDTSRQLAWAFRAVYQDVAAMSKPDPRLKTILARLEKELPLNLSTADKRILIENSLKSRLGFAADYHPDRIQVLFKDLQASLMVPPRSGKK
jgi:Cytochrome c554 and c-prime